MRDRRVAPLGLMPAGDGGRSFAASCGGGPACYNTPRGCDDTPRVQVLPKALVVALILWGTFGPLAAHRFCCVCVCVCACVRACVCIYVYIYIHTYIHTYIRIYMDTYIHIYIYTYIHTYTDIQIYTYIHTYTYMNRFVYAYTHIYT